MKYAHTFLSIILVSASYSVNAANEPSYLKNKSDFVQQVYSNVLVGFAFEKKCNFLEKTKQVEFEQRLNSATEIFRAYIVAKEMVVNPTEALNYSKEMAMGAIRYAGVSDCDSTAQDRVNKGFDTANNFMSLIDDELKKDAL